MKKCTNVVQVHTCSFIRLEMARKMVETTIFQIRKKMCYEFFFFLFKYCYFALFNSFHNFSFNSFLTEAGKKVPLFMLLKCDDA